MTDPTKRRLPELLKWHAEMMDELNAVTTKHIRIAEAEGHDARQIEMSLLSAFINRAVHFTPGGAEKITTLAVAEIFDNFRPGWRRNP